jgi:hypothetical protein
MSKKTFVMVFITVIFSIIPILWFNHYPLEDYPNHLAILQIRKTISTNPDLQRFYEFRWIFTPYLGLHLLATPLLPFFPVEFIGRIVITFTFAMICGGAILLDRELNGDNWGLSLFAGIFLYNGAFMWGFINYMIGIGFSMLSFWIWVRYREKAAYTWILFTVLGGIVSLMHFYAFAIYGICVAGYECSVFWERLTIERQVRISLFRIPLRAAPSLMVPLLIVIWLSPVSSNHGVVWTHGDDTFWYGKVQGLASPILFSYHISEKPLLLVILAIFGWAVVTRTIVVNSRMVVPLAAFGVIFMVMPFQLFGADFADYRLPSGIAFFALASMGWGNTSRARIEILSLLLAVCLIVRVGSVLSNWQTAQAIIEEYDSALQLVPPGSRLLVKLGYTGLRWVDHNPPLGQVPILAAAKRGVFVPDIFTDDGQLVNGIQLLKLRPDYRNYQEENRLVSTVSDITRFDYLLEIRKPEVKFPTGISLNEVGRGRTFTLYRIDQD